MIKGDQTINVSDATLIMRIQQSDKEAFTIFYERYRTRMYLAAYHILRDDDDANDAVQDLFSEIWQRPDRISPDGNIIGYIYTIMRNRVLTQISRSKYFDEYVNSYLAFESAGSECTEETILANELQRVLEEKISHLPSKMREVYELSWQEHLSNKEIAHRMSITEGTVKQHKYQALRILRGKLQHLVSYLLF